MKSATYNTDERVYTHTYDLAGNRLSELLSGTQVTDTDRYFGNNAANQLIAEGDTLDGNGNVIADYTYEYDNNGNLRYKKDTVPTTLETYTWDSANRLLSVGNHSYAYDGNGARIQKTISSVVTDYLLDVQPGLTQVLRESDGTNTNHYIHSPRGIHAMNDGTNWSYMLQDGLGSVRAEIAQNVTVNGSQSYAPYGEVFGASGSFASSYGFTGEQTDGNGQVYVRARYYNPSLGTWIKQDLIETQNRYGYASGNPINAIDHTGLFPNLIDELNRVVSEQGIKFASNIISTGRATHEYVNAEVSRVGIQHATNVISTAREVIPWEHVASYDSFRRNVICSIPSPLAPIFCQDKVQQIASNPIKALIGMTPQGAATSYVQEVNALNQMSPEERNAVGFSIFGQQVSNFITPYGDAISRTVSSLQQGNWGDAAIGSFDVIFGGSGDHAKVGAKRQPQHHQQSYQDTNTGIEIVDPCSRHEFAFAEVNVRLVLSSAFVAF